MRRVKPLYVAPPALHWLGVQIRPQLRYISKDNDKTYEKVDGGLLVRVQDRIVEVSPDVLWICQIG